MKMERKNEEIFDRLDRQFADITKSGDAMWTFKSLVDRDEKGAFEIAKTFLEKEDYQKALQLFSQLSTHFPKNQEYLTWFARTFYEKGDGIKAAQVAKKALSLNDNNSMAHLIMGTNHFPMELGESLEEYNKSIELDPNFDEAYLARAIFYHNTKQLDKTIKDLDKVIELNPKSQIAYLMLALTYLESKNLEMANKHYEDFEKFLPSQDRSTYLSDQKTREYFNKILERFAFYKLIRPSLLDNLKGSFEHLINTLPIEHKGAKIVPFIVMESLINTIEYSNKLDPIIR
jgi:tetratricopeptide (TPR) repeat protein